MAQTNNSKPHESLPLVLHPRIFDALGSDLVTSDVVAIIELVKNAYDAMATNVNIRFEYDSRQGHTIEVEDDGIGMPKSVLLEAWCTVATPYRVSHPISRKGSASRRTTGAKGLGRLSAARLGDRMVLRTRNAQANEAWEIRADWRAISSAARIDQCRVDLLKYDGQSLPKSGTIVRIEQLKSSWNERNFDELSDALSRLLSPFDTTGDFRIQLSRFDIANSATTIEPSPFVRNPTYVIAGNLDKFGNLSWKYKYSPLEGNGSQATGKDTWEQVARSINDTLAKDRRIDLGSAPMCGPFKFEIRAWDLDKESLGKAERVFGSGRALLRRQIRSFKGISVYRDAVLVLPKSEGGRDWLGLDLRRVSKLGARLSTSQIVGHVAISAEHNANITDTSDRERLVRNDAVEVFEFALKHVVSILELQRAASIEADEAPLKLRDLFADLSPSRLMTEIEELASEDADAEDVIPLVEKFAKAASSAAEKIERQFHYYSRLATIGTIAELLVHEVGNYCSTLESFLTAIRSNRGGKDNGREIDRRLPLAETAIGALQRLAERFRPLASRTFKRGTRFANVSESVDATLVALSGSISSSGIAVEKLIPADLLVRADPGELFPILYNLIDNAAYWLTRVGKEGRRLRLRGIKRAQTVVIEISDNGPGVASNDLSRIFHAGVTRRPGGAGMGLTVAGELAEQNGGRISVETPAKLGGATFIVELPEATA